MAQYEDDEQMRQLSELTYEQALERTIDLFAQTFRVADESGHSLDTAARTCVSLGATSEVLLIEAGVLEHGNPDFRTACLKYLDEVIKLKSIPTMEV